MPTRSERISIIRIWMQRIVADDSITWFDDLHVDQIDPEWRRKENWLDSAVEAVGMAIDVRDELGLDLPLAVALSLEAIDPGPNNREDLERQMDWSPPSLYLFQRGQEPWTGAQGSADIQELDPQDFGIHTGKLYTLRFVSSNTGEAIKSLWITA